MELVRRFLAPPAGSFFLFGPRGVGKSCWLADTFPDALTINLLQRDAFMKFSENPDLLFDSVTEERERRGGRPFPVVVDEIQRIPELLDAVHRSIFAYPEVRFALTGSSARKLRRGGVNLLAGRAIRKELHPFTAAELGERFSLEKALVQGMLPVVWAAPEPLETLRTYVGTYMDEEIRQEGFVRKVGEFARFLKAAAFSQCGTTNREALARECGVSGHTANAYLSILEDLLLSFSVPVFAGRPKRKLLRGEKFYFADVGIYGSLLPLGQRGRENFYRGFAMESLVAQHLRAWCAGRGADRAQLHTWRTASGLEVDFVVEEGDGALHAIEVKSGDTLHPEYFRGLRAIAEDFPEINLYVTCKTRALKFGPRKKKACKFFSDG
ncbi:MAG: DUF4143 domain-containing protein [Puniceicoccales bacterium]|jgi:predicted AAA+ superfamily ATPase|nr:DUF4143 domain-containing protein [Puniceicoccales bacterium]